MIIAETSEVVGTKETMIETEEDAHAPDQLNADDIMTEDIKRKIPWQHIPTFKSERMLLIRI